MNKAFVTLLIRSFRGGQATIAHYFYAISYYIIAVTGGGCFERTKISFIPKALLAKGAQLGTILSFMMGVTTLSLPSMIMLRKAVKPKLLGIFIVICAVGIIIVGYFFNAIQYLLV